MKMGLLVSCYYIAYVFRKIKKLEVKKEGERGLLKWCLIVLYII